MQLMLAAKAFPRGDNDNQAMGWSCDSGEFDKYADVLDALLVAGFLTCLDQVSAAGEDDLYWRISEYGMRRLTFNVVMRLSGLQKLADIRPNLALSAMTTYELLLVLQDGGWVWRRRTRAARATCHIVDAEPPGRTWYGGKRVERDYVLALLDGPRLCKKFGITLIPHGAVPKVYRRLLEGHAYDPDAIDALEDVRAWDEDGMAAIEDADEDEHSGDSRGDPVSDHLEDEEALESSSEVVTVVPMIVSIPLFHDGGCPQCPHPAHPNAGGGSPLGGSREAGPLILLLTTHAFLAAHTLPPYTPLRPPTLASYLRLTKRIEKKRHRTMLNLHEGKANLQDLVADRVVLLIAQVSLRSRTCWAMRQGTRHGVASSFALPRPDSRSCARGTD